MSAVLIPPVAPPAAPAVPRKTLAELLHDLGEIPAGRVRLHPYPGTATEADALSVIHSGTPCELVNGTLVEKPMGVPESFFAVAIATYLNIFVWPRRLGMTTAPDGPFRMTRGNTRLPDVTFTRRSRLPNPLPQVGGWCPDLCVEILSPDNSRAEMAMKRGEYFASGCRLVWEIDPRTRTATAYTDPTTAVPVAADGSLDGGDVLPGFVLPLAELFARLDDLGPADAPPPA